MSLRRVGSILLGALWLLVFPTAAHGSGHGPVFGAATPTLGKGGWAFDQAMADSCCAGQEQTHQSGPTVNAARPLAPAVASAVLPSAFQFNAADVESGRRLPSSNVYRFHDPPGLPGPPLRI